ncbi:MAG: thiol peroxidase [Kiritimatiellae bacterium]|nr:thiol peroxidase [Kiritimatiellia bacterium]
MAKTAFKGKPVKTVGELPALGAPAPAFELATADLGSYTLAGVRGKWAVLNIFPSIDTSVCAASVRHFNADAAARPNVAVLCISADLPFAQARFCGAEGIKHVITLSAFRSPAFGRDYGVLIGDSPLAGLLARAVIVVDPRGVVRHAQLVPEISQEPDYSAALAAIQA